MIFFILLLVFLIIYLIPKVNHNIKFFIILLILIVLAAFRSGIGADYYSYSYLYSKVDSTSLFKTLSLDLRVEPLFSAFMYLFKSKSLSSHIFIASVSITILLIMSLWIYKNSSDKILSLIIFYGVFYFVWSLSALRQGVVMSIGSVLFFSKDIKLSLKRKLIVVFLLSFIHVSALLYIPFIMISNKDIKTSTLIRILFLSIIVSFIPFKLILSPFQNIYVIRKLLSKTTDGIPIKSFSYLVRLGLSLISIFILKINRENKYLNKLLTYFVLGFSLYFAISFSDVIASRANIFTYILFILIVPEVLNLGILNVDYKFVNSKQIMYVGLCLFLVLSVYKETNAIKHQVEYLGNERFLPLKTIFNPEIEKFGTKEAYILSRERIDTAMIYEYNDEKSTDISELIEGNHENYLVYSNKLKHPIIINSQGKVVYNEKIPGELNLYNDIVVSNWQMPLLSDIRYFDLSKENRTENEMLKNVLEEIEKEFIFNKADEEYIEFEFENLPNKTQDLFLNKNALQGTYLYKIKRPFEYYILVAEYQYNKYHVYLDQELNPLMDYIFLGKGKFDQNGFLKVRFQSNDYIFNEEGNLLWIE